MRDNKDARTRDESERSLPFFARYLEGQNSTEQFFGTLKYPSDFDEMDQTMKYPSDSDEGDPSSY